MVLGYRISKPVSRWLSQSALYKLRKENKLNNCVDVIKPFIPEMKSLKTFSVNSLHPFYLLNFYEISISQKPD